MKRGNPLLGPAPQAYPFSGLLREDLYPGERSFFAANPNVAGMAADDNRVVLNPSPAPGVNLKPVFLNEAARIFMRQYGTPEFGVTPEQQGALPGPYAGAPPEAQRGTLLARVLSGDPSVTGVTDEQRAAADALMRRMWGWKGNGP